MARAVTVCGAEEEAAAAAAYKVGTSRDHTAGLGYAGFNTKNDTQNRQKLFRLHIYVFFCCLYGLQDFAFVHSVFV